jgi:hypothetical protein
MEIWRCILELPSDPAKQRFIQCFTAGHVTLAGDPETPNPKKKDGTRVPLRTVMHRHISIRHPHHPS